MSDEKYTWDYRNPYEWMERVRKSSFPPMIVQVALTGGFHGKEANPNVPETPEEQADAAYAAYKAGASVVHVHARDRNNWAQTTSSPDDYSKVNRMIRERCPDIIINNTTGGGPTMSTEDRMAGLYADPRPDMASLNPGPFMLRFTQAERPAPLPNPRPPKDIDIAMPITYGEVDRMADVMIEKGIKPEVELFHHGHFHVINGLIKSGRLKPPYAIQFVMGFPTSVYPTPQNIISLLSELPSGSIFLLPGVGSFQVSMTAMAMILGGHVRVGMEDNLYYKRGELAKNNAQFVERAVRMAHELNREVATPKQAREILGLPQVS